MRLRRFRPPARAGGDSRISRTRTRFPKPRCDPFEHPTESAAPASSGQPPWATRPGAGHQSKTIRRGAKMADLLAWEVVRLRASCNGRLRTPPGPEGINGTG